LEKFILATAVGFAYVAIVGAALELFLVSLRAYFWSLTTIFALGSVVISFWYRKKARPLSLTNKDPVTSSGVGLRDGLIILASIVCAVSVRLEEVVSYPLLLANDPWLWMGITRCLYFTGNRLAYSPIDVYPFGFAYLFAYGWNGDNQTLMLALRFFSPIVFVPLTLITVYLISKRVTGNLQFGVLSTLMFSSMYYYAWRTKMTLPDAPSFFLVAIFLLLLLSESLTSLKGVLLAGTVLSGAWLYHPITALPAISMVPVLFVQYILQKKFTKCFRLIILGLVAFLLALPNLLMWFSNLSYVIEWTKKAYAPVMARFDPIDLIRSLFNLGYSWVIYILASIGSIKLNPKQRALVLYLLILVFYIFSPYTSIVFGAYNVRFVEYLALPVSILSVNAIRLFYGSAIKLSLKRYSKRVVVGQVKLSVITLIIILALVPTQLQWAYRSHVGISFKVTSALQESADFINYSTPLSSNVQILTTTYGHYYYYFAMLAPRRIHLISLDTFKTYVSVDAADKLDHWNSSVVGGLAVDTMSFKSGIGSIRLYSTERGWVSLFITGSWDLSQCQQFSFFSKVRNKQTIDAFFVKMTDSNGRTAYWHSYDARNALLVLQENEWVSNRIILESPTSSEIPGLNLSNITSIWFVFHNFRGEPFVFWVDELTGVGMDQTSFLTYLQENRISVIVAEIKEEAKLRALVRCDVVSDYKVFGNEIAVIQLRM
jgi:hypothetical protein